MKEMEHIEKEGTWYLLVASGSKDLLGPGTNTAIGHAQTSNRRGPKNRNHVPVARL
jgi:hypothetical protein